MTDFTALQGEAERHVRARRWLEAARAFARLATACQQSKHLEEARQAWDAAGEAWRRDDQPVPAARALRMAIALGGDDDTGAVARVKLAGVLGEVGELRRAEAACRRVLEVGSAPLVRGLALDTLISMLQAMGRKEEARVALEELSSMAGGQLPIAAAFRQSQLHRLDGRLEEAEGSLAVVFEALHDRPEALAGFAAARGELAEVALLRGKHADAIALFEEASEGQRSSGRASLDLRARAGRIRAMVEAGIQPLPGSLDEGIALAVARGMAVLEVDLRIARGMERSTSDTAGAARDLDRAMGEADRIGALIRAGRARLERATRVPASCAHRVELLAHAAEQLAGAIPWETRVLLGTAGAIAVVDLSLARAYAATAIARFAAMGMEFDRRKAQALLAELA